MSGPQTILGINGRSQGAINVLEKIIIGSGNQLRPENVQTLIDLINSGATKVITNFTDTSEMLANTTIQTDTFAKVSDASGYNSLTTNEFAIYQYLGGDRSNISSYYLVLARQWFDADQLDYDNSSSGLTADDVQAALDELKTLIDNQALGVSWKSPAARVATTANITLSGEQTIDGISVVDGDKVLVKNQTNSEENGIYVASTGAWSRSPDADTAAKLEGAVIGVLEGTANENKIYQQTETGITLDTDPVVWEIFSGSVVPDWSETTAGKVEKANQTEAESGADGTEGNRDHTKGMTARAVRWLIDAMNFITQTVFDAHTSDTDNPHSVTKTQVGLGNVDNTADADKPVSTAQQAALDDKVDKYSATVGNIPQSNGSTLVDSGKSWATQSQAEAGTSNNAVMTALRNLQAFVYFVANQTFAALNTTSKTIVGAINELFSNKADKSNVLELNNTDAFTPDADYEPATKKYVDDNAGASSWGSITGTLSDQTDLQSALDAKASTALTTDRMEIGEGGVRAEKTASQVKTFLSLNNVDNTSDADKPVSTAQQTALDAKADKDDTIPNGNLLKKKSGGSYENSGEHADMLKSISNSVTDTTSLKTVATVNLKAGTQILWRSAASEKIEIYTLVAGTDAEDLPAIARPNDYAATTNEKVWKLSLDGASLVDLSQIDLSDINEGESKILLVEKESGTGNPIFGGAVSQVDKLVASSFDTLLADTAAWVADEITLTGDNREGQLGQNGQEHQMNGQFYLCTSHNFGTDASNGSATWVRNRSRDALNPNISSDQAVITELEDPTGWDGNDSKVITVRSKVGSWYSAASGYVYFCYDESGSNWYWRRVGVPTAEFIQISDATLISEIEAHDFGTTPILEPVATEKGKDRQEHYWETGGGTVPNLAKCIDVSGTKKWIKIL